jgi:outer membrane protein
MMRHVLRAACAAVFVMFALPLVHSGPAAAGNTSTPTTKATSPTTTTGDAGTASPTGAATQGDAGTLTAGATGSDTPAVPAAATPAGPAARPLVLLVIDVQQIYAKSKAAQGVQATMEKQRTNYQNEIAKRENALRDSDQELMRQRSSLSADAFNQKRQQLEQQADALRKDVQVKKQQFDDIFQGAMDKVRVVLVEIVTDIAKEQGATMVLSKAAVLIGPSNMDITDEALKRLDAKLPSVQVDLKTK